MMTETVKTKPLFGVPRVNHNLTTINIHGTAPLKHLVPQSTDKKKEVEVSQSTQCTDDSKTPARDPPAQRILGDSKMKVKKIKDPLAPKKAANSFILFCKEERPRVVELLGSKVPGPVAAELSKRWADIGKEGKDKWEQMAKEEKLKYEKAIENYRPSEEFLKSKIAHEKKLIEASGDLSVKVEKMAAYFTFVSANWMKVATSKPGEGMTIVEIQEKLLYQWSRASGNVESGGEKSTKFKKKKVKDPNAPKRPMSAYLLFVKENRAAIAKENPAMKNTEVLSEVGRRWKTLDEVSRGAFEEEANKKKTEYQVEMSKFKGVQDASL